MKRIEEHLVILRYSDCNNVIHDVDLNSILEGGVPIDEEYNFYNRKESAQEALRCGQVEVGKANIRHKFDGYELYSEDLW